MARAFVPGSTIHAIHAKPKFLRGGEVGREQDGVDRALAEHPEYLLLTG